MNNDKGRIKIMFIFLLVVIFVVLFSKFTIGVRHRNEEIYNKTEELFEAAKCDEAIEEIQKIPTFYEYKGTKELLDKYNVEYYECPKCGMIDFTR